MNNKPRVIKDYVKLPESIKEQIKLFYPHGYERALIKFKDAKGNIVSALPFEAEDKYYMVRMTVSQAQAIVSNDDDYDEDGMLKELSRVDYEAKHMADEGEEIDLDAYASDEEVY